MNVWLSQDPADTQFSAISGADSDSRHINIFQINQRMILGGSERGGRVEISQNIFYLFNRRNG